MAKNCEATNRSQPNVAVVRTNQPITLVEVGGEGSRVGWKENMVEVGEKARRYANRLSEARLPVPRVLPQRAGNVSQTGKTQYAVHGGGWQQCARSQ